MKRIVAVSVVGFALVSSSAYAARSEDRAVHGTVQSVDTSTRTAVVKAVDGAEHTVYVAARTAVYGTEAATKDAFRDLQEGTDVIIHYTRNGARETALEIDNLGKDGLKRAEGTVTELDRATRQLVVTTADGTKETFVLTKRATDEAGRDIANRVEKATKVTVYYTERAGHKVVHYFERA